MQMCFIFYFYLFLTVSQKNAWGNERSGTAVFRENLVAICTHDKRLWIWIWIWMANFISTANLDRTERQCLLISQSLMTGLAPSARQCFPSVKFGRLVVPSKHYDWSVRRAINRADKQTDRQNLHLQTPPTLQRATKSDV